MYDALSTFMMFFTSSYYAGFYDVHRQAFADYLDAWSLLKMSKM